MFLRLITSTFIISIILIGPSYAYLDPGSGSMIMQILAAIGVSIIAFLRQIKLLIINIKNYIQKLFGKFFKS